LGPAPAAEHHAHALAFAAAAGAAPGRAADLGTGGGVPGLVLAEHWPDSTWVLIETDGRRAAFLDDAVARLGLAARVVVLHARAEDIGRDQQQRATFDLVTSRSFGKPAVAAECAAPLLRLGGVFVVSDPPAGAGDRWPAGALAELGLEVASRSENPQLTVLRQAQACPDRFPRRAGLPAKRPLF
jgi:16S rRNA (guanine527-N7)-methyltransferase